MDKAAERPPGAQATRIVRPEFTGSAGEYFRIWIVNLFFTLVTLGIYSAWTKVRKKKYFYARTCFDGETFDCFGRPIAILKGRIVAFIVFVTTTLRGPTSPPVSPRRETSATACGSLPHTRA